MTVLIVFLVSLVCITAQLQDIELFSADNNLPHEGSVQGLYANINCSSFMNTVIKVAANLPNFNNPIGQARMYVAIKPANGLYAPFPDPTDSSTYAYTTFNLNNFTISPYVVFNTGVTPALYITMYCPNSQCEYNVVISQTTAAVTEITNWKHQDSNLKLKRDPEIDIKRLMMRNKIRVNGSVNYAQWNTVILPVCGNTLAGIYHPTETVCLEATVMGTMLGYLFYQQISTYANQNPNVPMWYQRAPDIQEPIRDLTGTQKLPVNRYRTTPISVTTLQQVNYVYHSIVGEGGEGSLSPFPNYFIASYEWFQCNS